MVAAAALQLQFENAALASWPEAQRAVLMAGANEDVDGVVLDLNDGTDDRDGAGELNFENNVLIGDSARKVNGNNVAAGIGHDYGTMVFADPLHFADGWFREVYNVRVTTAGLSLRAVLAWDSTAACTNGSDPSSCTQNTLDADLDLYLYDTFGNLIKKSSSYDNSYEFIQIPIEANKTYLLKVKKYSNANQSTYFGLAWTTW